MGKDTMKVSIDRGVLLKPLGHIQGVVERRNTIAILSNVIVKAEAGNLSVTATDMDMDIVETFPASVSTEGVVTASAHMLFDIVRKLPDGAEISLEAAGDGILAISAGRSNFSMPTLPVDDYPVISADDLSCSFTIAASDLKTMIRRTRVATSTEESRYYLNGIYLHPTDDRMLRAVSTDGHRLAMTQIALPQGAETMPSVIVPRKACGELAKLIDEHDGDITIALSEKRIAFTIGSVRMSTRLIEGTFPDYERVIPKDNTQKAQVSVTEFSTAVDRVSTISEDKTRAVKLKFSNDSLTLLASGADHASATEIIEALCPSTEIEIGFNARYMLDIAALIDDDMIEFAFSDSATPTLITAPQDSSSLFVLMPMRT